MSLFSWRASIQALRRDELPGSFDGGVLIAALLLAGFGCLMVASSSIAIAEGAGAGPGYYLLRHLVFLVLGSGLAIALMATPMEKLERHGPVLLLLAILLLLAVFVPGLGRKINGARRWLNFGLSNFQAVEAVKLAFVVYLSSYLTRRGAQVRASLFGVIKPLMVTGVLIVLLLLQPDFGSSMLLITIAIGLVWIAGAGFRHLGGMLLLGMPAMAVAAISAPYRVKRLLTFVNPWEDPFDKGFQLVQALIAVGRGEWFGVGLGASVQKLYYLPEAHTDFILAVIAEEFGLVGIVVLLLLFGLLVGRALSIGLRGLNVGQTFAGYCACGVGLWIAAQALVSIGVNLGILPTKGLTLPLISSGGSSVLMTLAAIGLLLRSSYEVSRAEAQAALDQANPVDGGAA